MKRGRIKTIIRRLGVPPPFSESIVMKSKHSDKHRDHMSLGSTGEILTGFLPKSIYVYIILYSRILKGRREIFTINKNHQWALFKEKGAKSGFVLYRKSTYAFKYAFDEEKMASETYGEEVCGRGGTCEFKTPHVQTAQKATQTFNKFHF